MNLLMRTASSSCTEFVTEAIKETMSKEEPLLDEPGILSDQLQDRLETISKLARLDQCHTIIITATAWDDSYAPLTTSPTGMLRQLAFACLISEAKEHINDMLS